jgi:hypothetical protein
LLKSCDWGIRFSIGVDHCGDGAILRRLPHSF